jgi:hypothetical protein
MASQEPAYVAIAQRKQEALAAAIPAEWRLPAHLIPAGMLSPAESITEGPKQYGRVNVMEIPRTCGILTAKELEITEKYDVRGLVAAMTGGKLKAEEVIRGFCKVSGTKGIFVNLVRHTYIFLESSNCSSTYPLYHRAPLRSSTTPGKGT